MSETDVSPVQPEVAPAVVTAVGAGSVLVARDVESKPPSLLDAGGKPPSGLVFVEFLSLPRLVTWNASSW